MPSSNIACAPAIIHLAWEAHPQSVLDIGPGRGKYGLLLREYLGMNLRVDACEVEASYRTPLLSAIYHKVYPVDARILSDETLELYDLVLMADVIEHIPKADALALLDRIPGIVVICTPRDYFEQHIPGVPSEDHVSHWTVQDFADTGRLDRHDVGVLDGLGAIIVRLGPKP